MACSSQDMGCGASLVGVLDGGLRINPEAMAKSDERSSCIGTVTSMPSCVSVISMAFHIAMEYGHSLSRWVRCSVGGLVFGSVGL